MICKRYIYLYNDEVSKNTGMYISIAHVHTALLKVLCSTYVPGVPSWAPYADLINHQHSSVGKQCVTLCSAILLLLFLSTTSFASATSAVPLASEGATSCGKVCNLVYAIRKHMKNMLFFRKGGNLCGALLRGSELAPVYPPMAIPMRHPVIARLFASIVCKLREEFANRQIQLYWIMYIDYCQLIVCGCIEICAHLMKVM